MRKIVSLTVNPCIDLNMEVSRIIPGPKLRTEKVSYEAGGGGINLSRVIKSLGGDALTIYYAGGYHGKMIGDFLQGEKISQKPIFIRGQTRENITVSDSRSADQYRFVVNGPAIEEDKLSELLGFIENSGSRTDYLVASGSLSPGMPEDFYLKLSKICSKSGIRFVIDTSGKALRSVLDNKAYLIKPNLKELSYLMGEPLKSEPQQRGAAMNIVKHGQSEIVVVSLGDKGAFMASKKGITEIPAPGVRVESAVGAGDSMLGGIVFGLASGKSLLNAGQLGVAAGTAACLTPGTQLCRKEDVFRLYDEIKREKLISGKAENG